MYNYLVIDGYLNGTGIRDYYVGGFIDPHKLKISTPLINRLKSWVREYENEHYLEFKNKEKIKLLDEEGKKIAQLIKSELGNCKIQYLSAATFQKENI